MRLSVLLLALTSAAGCVRSVGPPGVDQGLWTEITAIRAVDHHAHPQPALAPGAVDLGWDELIGTDAPPPWSPPLRLRPASGGLVAAARALYDYPYDDASDAHLADLASRKARVMQAQGAGYPVWVLDHLGIETMVANRVAMAPSLPAARFKWVAFVDALLLPFDPTRVFPSNPETRAFLQGILRVRDGFFADAGERTLPATYAEYVARVIVPTLRRLEEQGAIGIKFEAAYLRPLDFRAASPQAASRVYAHYVRGGAPSGEDYALLQNALFREIATEAGRLRLAIHLHTGAGAGSFFALAGSDPLLLEDAIDDPALRNTRFVLVHGGWPFEKSTAYLLGKPNVWADFSAQTFLLTPRELARVLRLWLSWYPEKVMFGTDGCELVPGFGWEEVAWLSATTGREALALALGDMLRDGEITRARASELARMVLRDNARELYGLDAH